MKRSSWRHDTEPAPPPPPRNLLVREAVRMKNKTAGLLMEVSAPYFFTSCRSQAPCASETFYQ